MDDISASFDEYWNSQWAYPLNSIPKQTSRASDSIEFRSRLSATSKPLYELLGEMSFDEFLAANEPELICCKVEVVADTPTKIAGSKAAESPVIQRLHVLGDQATEEMLIENAYFIPGRNGLQALGRTRARGVTVKILTNSLASNDAGFSHAGYKKYREIAFIGSFNLDPRSTFINTEIGLIIHDAEFAGKLAEFIMTGMQPDNSWQLKLTSDNKIQWRGEQTRNRIVASLLALLPIEQQL